MSNDIDKDETMSNDLNDQHTGDQHTSGDIESLEFSVEYDDAGSFGEAPAQPAAGTAQDDTDKAAKPAVDTDANATATSANASHVDQTMRLAKGKNASKTNAATERAYATTNHRLDRQVRDRVLLKSYPTFSLNHVTTTARKTGRHVLDDLSMAFYAGTLYAVKVLSDEDDSEQRTTLMAVMGAFMAPTSGEVMSKSSNFTELELGELRGHRLGLVPQRYAVRGDLDAEGNLLYAMNGSGRGFLKPKPVIAREMLQSVGYTEATSGKKVSELSPLDQRRVAIARALCCDAETVILDEPTKGLSESDAAELLELLRRIARSRDPKRVVIIVTSDDAVASAAQKVYDLTD